MFITDFVGTTYRLSVLKVAFIYRKLGKMTKPSHLPKRQLHYERNE